MTQEADITDNPTLLLADDDETFCQVLAQALKKRGYRVLVAHCVADAVAMIKEEAPEYAVVDLKMSADSGLVLVKELQALEADTRIVVLTGYASIATAVEAIKLGATHYLAKPADADEIIAAFHKAQGDDAIPVSSSPLSVERLEWEHIQRILNDHDGNISATARALKMHRRTLQRKLGKRPSKK